MNAVEEGKQIKNAVLNVLREVQRPGQRMKLERIRRIVGATSAAAVHYAMDILYQEGLMDERQQVR